MSQSASDRPRSNPDSAKTKGILLLASILTAVALLLGSLLPSATPPHKPPVSGSSGGKAGAVTLDTRLSGTHVLRDGDGTLYLDIGLRADDRKRTKRLPLNIALVIDRSGSMSGRKLRDAKAAARALVQRLGERDRLALIDYGSDVFLRVASTYVTTTARPRILAAIEGITDRGGTFLSGAVERGRDEVLRHIAKGKVNRVILISDGQANEGVTAPPALSALSAKIAAAGVSVTTMGVGLDFDEDVLTKMANNGNGHYYFIGNSRNLASIFSKELDIMMGTIAQRPVLRITLADKVELDTVYGHPFKRNGRVITVSLPDIHSAQRRKVLAKLRVPTKRLGAAAVARVELAFADADSGRHLKVFGTTRVTVTASRETVRTGQNAAVLARVTQARIADKLQSAMQAYQRGDVASARTTLRQQIQRTRHLNRTLRSPALGGVVRRLRRELRKTSAAPASPAGRALIKRNKAHAYDLYR